MAFPKTEAIKGIAEKIVSGEYEVFVCKDFQCITYQVQNGPCVFAIPAHPDFMPPDCPYNCSPSPKISVEPLTCHPDEYEHEDEI